MNNDYYITLLEENRRLIHSALKKLGIYYTHKNFEDYFQKATIIFLETCANAPYSLQEKNNWKKFSGYVYQKIVWTIIDEWRKEEKEIYVYLDFSDEAVTNQFVESQYNPEAECLLQDTLRLFIPFLSPIELLYLEETLVNDLSITEIAKKHHLARTSLYRVKRSLQRKWKNKMK